MTEIDRIQERWATLADRLYNDSKVGTQNLKCQIAASPFLIILANLCKYQMSYNRMMCGSILVSSMLEI